MEQCTIRLIWNVDHYDVVIPELGNEVRATGITREEAQDKGQAIIENHWLAQFEKQEQRTVA
jgi:hypothetical protein